MSQRLDIDALQALCAIQDQGGVTRAAAHLALSQSAVSHKIKRLEAHLGRTLLTRRTGGPAFTEEGQKLLSYARRILALHDEAVQSLSSRPLKGHLRLGMTEDTTSSGLSRILGRFARLHPDVTVRTHVAQSLVLEDQLDRGEIDLAVMQIFQHRMQPADQLIYLDKLHWVKARDYVLDLNSPVPFLAFDSNCFYKHWAEQTAHLPPAGLAMAFECASAAGIVSAVASGLGVALLNARHLTPEIEVIDEAFGVTPPDIAYVVRIGSKSRSDIARSLAAGIAGEHDALTNRNAA